MGDGIERFRVALGITPRSQVQIRHAQLDPVTANSRGFGLTVKAEAKRLGFFRFDRLFWQGFVIWPRVALSLPVRPCGARWPRPASRIGPSRPNVSVCLSP
jgi:hypothetical protein